MLGDTGTLIGEFRKRDKKIVFGWGGRCTAPVTRGAIDQPKRGCSPVRRHCCSCGYCFCYCCCCCSATVRIGVTATAATAATAAVGLN